MYKYYRSTASFLFLLLVILTMIAPYSHAGSNVPLTNLTDSKARCLDGTLSGYYYEKASTSRGTNKWVIYLEGGGECTTQTVRFCLLT
jgi:hypothetical protein